MQISLGATTGGANLVADAHIAALAIEQRAVLHSHDSDFGHSRASNGTILYDLLSVHYI